MLKENISQEFRLKNIDKTRNYCVEEIQQNELMSKKKKKVCTTLNYIEHFLILVSAVNGCISISAFGSLLGIPIGITSSAKGLKIFTITAGIKKYKSVNQKKKHDKSLRTIESCISHDEFVSINFVLKEYDDMKEEIDNVKKTIAL